jgi:hypothetical protein
VVAGVTKSEIIVPTRMATFKLSLKIWVWGGVQHWRRGIGRLVSSKPKKKCPKEVFLTWSAREIASGKSFSWITLLGVIQISSQAIDCKKFENDELHFVGF